MDKLTIKEKKKYIIIGYYFGSLIGLIIGLICCYLVYLDVSNQCNAFILKEYIDIPIISYISSLYLK